MEKTKLTVVTTFSGIGMQERGLINSDCFDIDVLATSDIDKDAILSYAAIHNGLTMEKVKSYNEYPDKETMVKELIEKNIGFDFKRKKLFNWNRLANKKDDTELKKYWLAMKLSKNMGDVSLVKKLPASDLLFFSFPCTDISIAGRQDGLSYDDWKNGASTRSGLVWEIIRLLNVAKESHELPSYLILENVANLVSKSYIKDFEFFNKLVSEIGYNVYYQVINGKDTGIPQNRLRVFGVYIKKDIDKNNFVFPKPFDNGIRLKNILEKDVPLKYYLSKKVCDNFKFIPGSEDKNVIGDTKPEDCTRIGNRDVVYNTDGTIGALTATDYKQPKQVLIKSEKEQNEGRVYIPKKIREIANGYKLLEKVLENNKIEYQEGCDMTLNNPKVRDISNCIKARYDAGIDIRYQQTGCAVIEHETDKNKDYYYIRKLTPSECFILMGLTKEDCKSCQDIGESDGKLYKQAGNGIITNCVTLIAEHLYKAQYDMSYICSDEKENKKQE